MKSGDLEGESGFEPKAALLLYIFLYTLLGELLF